MKNNENFPEYYIRFPLRFLTCKINSAFKHFNTKLLLHYIDIYKIVRNFAFLSEVAFKHIRVNKICKLVISFKNNTNYFIF